MVGSTSFSKGGGRAQRAEKPFQPSYEHTTPFLAITPKARLKKRHKGVFLTFTVLVLVPLVVTSFYLFAFAQDQYVSRTGFTLRQEDENKAQPIDMVSFFSGSTQQVSGELLYEFIQSQTMVERVQSEINLTEHYTKNWPKDVAFSLWNNPSIEDVTWFWRRFVVVSYDRASQLFDIEVRAFSPELAQKIAQIIIEESQKAINALNDKAREDTTALAKRDLDTAQEHLREARSALAEFRAQTRIVDPVNDIESRSGVVSRLQQELAQTLIERDMLRTTAQAGDLRHARLENRIKIIRARIDSEKNAISAENSFQGGASYPEILSDYESLQVDLEFAQNAYIAARSALDDARIAALRQGLYLAVFIPPTKAQDATYPKRFLLIATLGGFFLMLWAIIVLIYYSLKDRG